MSACTGKCCAVFNYSVGLDELRTREDEHSKFLVDMLVELTPDEAYERSVRFDLSPPSGFDLRTWADGATAYTCRHWDEETRLCGVYENRPRMCRDYPYDSKCQHDCECSFEVPEEIKVKYRKVEVT